MLIFSILSVLFLVLGTINIISRVQRLKKKKILQENWGTFNSSPSASDSVKSLENNLALEKREKKYDSFIDSQTWDDLDLQKIFKKINITESSLGAECLYNRLHLHVYSQNQTIEDTKDFFNKNNDVRLELQYLFTKLGKKNNNLTNKIIKGASNYKKEKLYLYFLLGIIPLLSLFLAIPFRTFGTVLFSCSFLFNIFFSLSKKYLMDLELERMSYLVQMIYIGKKISRYSFPKKNQLKNAIKEFSLLNIFGYTYKPDVEFVDMGVILEYLNFLFLIPIISHAYMVNKLKKHNLKAQSIYDILSELEAAISILNYEIALDYFCRPTFSTSKELTAKQIYHPLLTEPVANSIDFKENILIGGDNASGKSTFLRTVAVNIVLAQSINIALANEFSMQHGNIFTLIKVQDSISRGESYFMAESRIVKSILDRLNNAMVEQP
ncbi:MutS-related protein [Lactococcus lactis]|uniref:MutS-related protein n=1 Tax=Lactococcus lactis TaxID=1358 RepID=UPI0021A5A4D4|nr:hypothetical protein [Lactococcus lactis]MCT0051581.1 hypothetical protein [Lactococcus lactis subsp. lactis]